MLSLRPLHYGPTGEERAASKVARWLLGVVAVLASIIPAARAGRTDPLSALRVE